MIDSCEAIVMRAELEHSRKRDAKIAQHVNKQQKRLLMIAECAKRVMAKRRLAALLASQAPCADENYYMEES